jgi:hypothetical protein
VSGDQDGQPLQESAAVMTVPLMKVRRGAEIEKLRVATHSAPFIRLLPPAPELHLSFSVSFSP